MKPTTEEWLQERFDNTVEIAKTKTGSDFDGWIEDGRYLADAVRLTELGNALLEGLRVIDAATQGCPIRKSTKFIEVCPQCRAIQREPCGMWLNGLIQLENKARAIVAAQTAKAAN